MALPFPRLHGLRDAERNFYALDLKDDTIGGRLSAVEAFLGAWKPLREVGFTLPGGLAAATGTPSRDGGYSGLDTAGSIQPFLLDPADLAVVGYVTQLRLRLGAYTNGTAPGVTVTGRLSATSISGGADRLTSTEGATICSGALTLSAASRGFAATSAPVNAPAASHVQFFFQTSGTTAANSRAVVYAQLQYRHVRSS